MSLDSEVAYIENMDEEDLTNLVRLVSKLDPTEGSAEDVNTPRWSSVERDLILGCQEAAGDFVEPDLDEDENNYPDDDEEGELTEPPAETELRVQPWPYDESKS